MSWYRNSVFIMKGLREYTRSGYTRASADFCQSDLDVNCENLHVMVTGANSGVGRVLSEALARRGATVHMVCRNAAAAQSAAEQIRAAIENSRVHVHIVDLSRPRHVAQFTRDFCTRNAPLHVLINNAGCMVHEWRASEDDTALETNFATNTLALHMLVVGLAGVLGNEQQSRVVVVSSAGMLTQRLWTTGSVQSGSDAEFDGTAEYARNKRQQVVMVEQYAGRWRDIKFFSMHPGWADTPAVRTAMPDFYARMKDRLRTAEEGADTALWLAVSEAGYRQKSGEFFQDRRPVAKHLPLAWTHSDTQQEKELMKTLDEMYELYSK